MALDRDRLYASTPAPTRLERSLLTGSVSGTRRVLPPAPARILVARRRQGSRGGGARRLGYSSRRFEPVPSYVNAAQSWPRQASLTQTTPTSAGRLDDGEGPAVPLQAHTMPYPRLDSLTTCSREQRRVLRQPAPRATGPDPGQLLDRRTSARPRAGQRWTPPPGGCRRSRGSRRRLAARYASGS